MEFAISDVEDDERDYWIPRQELRTYTHVPCSPRSPHAETDEGNFPSRKLGKERESYVNHEVYDFPGKSNVTDP